MNEKQYNPIRSFFYFTTQRPVAITMIVLGVVVFGFLSYKQLSLTLMPDIAYPSLTVRTEYPGAAPEEVENAISRPLEEALSVVSNLVNISSISREGQSDIILEYDWDTDINEAMSEVREKLDMVFLPEDAQKPLILRYDPSLDPIIRLSLTGPQELVFIRYIAEEELKRELEGISGVAAVKVKGGYEEEIHIELDETRISVMGMNIRQILNRLAQENINLAGGTLKEGETEFIVRTMNEFRTVDEIGDITIGFTNNRVIKLRDIAKVTRATKEREVITRVNGLESVEIEIYKEADANIVEVAKNVLNKVFGTPEQRVFVASLEKMQKGKNDAATPSSPQDRMAQFRMQMMMESMTDFIAHKLPAGMKIDLLSDQSVFIENSINEVKSTAMIGGLLAILVLLLFLRDIKSTLIVGVSIPVSIIITFAPMNLMNITLNIMSLGGLALGIGMLVDNSIVVLESIFRCREEGDDLITAVVRGVSEVGTAVTASTLTTVAVFFPMVFVKGVAGQIFGDLGLTVVFSLLASLMIALFVIPMLASRKFELKGQNHSREMNTFRSLFTDRTYKTSDGIRQIRALLKKGRASYLLAGLHVVLLPVYMALDLLSLILSVIVFAAGILFTLIFGILGWLIQTLIIRFVGRYFSKGLQILLEKYEIFLRWSIRLRNKVLLGVFALFIFTIVLILPRVGSELIPEVHQGEFYVDLVYPVGTPVEKTIQLSAAIEEFIRQLPDVEKVATVAGTDKTMLSRSESGEHTARITVRLKSHKNLKDLEEKVIGEIRSFIQNIAGLENNISRPVLFSFKTPIEVVIKGYNIQKLLEVSKLAREELASIQGLYDVKTNLQTGNPEVQIRYDREKLAFYGLDLQEVASLVRTKVLGDVATQFKEEDRRIDIRVRVEEKDRAHLNQLANLNISPSVDRPIPLHAVADIKIVEGPSEIRRINQERAIVITANVAGRSLSDVSQDIYLKMQQMDLPGDFRYEIAGQNKEMEVSLNSLKLALMLAIFLVYIVMASQFESFLHPFIILFSVPLAFIGVIWTLWALSIPFSVVVFLGAIMLAGIVVNNAIVLIDYINHLRAKGMDLVEAVVLAGKVRLRPILMTTLTTVLGLLPMAIGLGDGAEIRTPMAITVIAGLTSSTLLTLVVIPSLYIWIEKYLLELRARQAGDETSPVEV